MTQRKAGCQTIMQIHDWLKLEYAILLDNKVINDENYTLVGLNKLCCFVNLEFN